MSKYFIDRPVFAWVIAIVIMLAGGLSILGLPIEQYPSIAPPSIRVSATYPGASAQTVEGTVTQVIEQQMNGLDHLRYISSNSDSSGTAQITLTFNPEADPDIAQVQVQNKLQLAMPRLPQEVQQQGVQVSKGNNTFLMVMGFVSSDGTMVQNDIADFVASSVQDPISRVTGVGTVTLFGAQHAMRIWMDPNKLISYGLTTTDVVNAIEAQNAEVSAGQIGGSPAAPGQQLNATIIAQSRLQTPEEFGRILIRVNTDGSQVRLSDVARIDVGAENYNTIARYNGKPAAGLGISLATGANALDTADAIRTRIAELEPFFPAGVEVVYPYDTTPFVKLSIEGVVHTLLEAIVLVFAIMYLFLQNFRATLIPTIAVPVVLLGTFGVLAAAGFTINTLTMFAMVLAIGLLVDDAIVVVENVERVMEEEGLSPKEATRKSMGQITGALIGIALVLSAVFVPMAFFSGSTGAIYRQFSLTVVSAMVLSVIVALVLTPALCATILKRRRAHGHQSHGHQPKRGFFGWFNRTFDRGNARYQRGVGHMIHKPGRYLVIYLLIVVGLGVLFMRLPSAFLPNEDQGILITQVSLPAGSSMERTLELVKAMEHHFLVDEKDTVNGLFTVTGFSFSGRGQNTALGFANLKDWSVRGSDEGSVFAIAQRAMASLSRVRDAMIFAFTPPAIIELGNATGFDMQLVDRGGLGHEKLMQARGQLLGLAAQNPKLAAVRPNGLDDNPQLRIDIDREKASALGLSLADINTTLQATWGSSYVNDFIENGRVKRVYIQADAQYRMLPSDLERWYMRNANGEMVPFSTFSTTPLGLRLAAPGTVQRRLLDQHPGAAGSGRQLGRGDGGDGGTGAAVAGQASASSGRACRTRNGCPARRLRRSTRSRSWSCSCASRPCMKAGRSRRRSSWWCRSASWAPCIAAHLRGLPNDVYFQVGLLTTIGLSAKNAILIVEFAKDMHRRRHGPAGGDARSLPPAPAADPDDVLRLHPGRAAAGDQHGGRIGQPERHRRRRDGRHDLGHRAGDLLRAGLLRDGADVWSPAGFPAKTDHGHAEPAQAD